MKRFFLTFLLAAVPVFPVLSGDPVPGKPDRGLHLLPGKTEDAGKIPELKKVRCSPESAVKVRVRIADATIRGDSSIRRMALKFFMTRPGTAFEIRQTNREEAISALREGKADIVLFDFTGKWCEEKGLAGFPYAAGAVAIYFSTLAPAGDYSVEQCAQMLTDDQFSPGAAPQKKEPLKRIVIKEDQPGGELPAILVLHDRNARLSPSLFRVNNVGAMLLFLQAGSLAAGIGPYVPGHPVTVHTATVNKIRPGVKNVCSGEYPLSFRRGILYRKEAFPETVKTFLNTLNTAEFADALAKENLLAIPFFDAGFSAF